MDVSCLFVNKLYKKRKVMNGGFTLVEVIAVLVILGILAAAAIPRYFDMQETARIKAIEGAIGELNGQVALAFAQNVIKGGPPGYCFGFGGDIGPDFIFNTPIVDGTTGCGTNGTIELASGTSGVHVWALI